MSPTAKDFEQSVEELKDSSGRIGAGLDRVLQLLDTFGERNAALLHDDAQVDDDKNEAMVRVRSIVSAIRSQVLDITEFSREFEKKVDEYGKEIIELSEEIEGRKKAADLDPMTGISNRHKFEEVLGGFVKDIASLQGKLSIFLADLDDFQKINTQLGDKMGDQMLRLVAKTLTENLKGSDMVARWSSDEFAAILPHTSTHDAATVADHIRESISTRVVRHRETGDILGQLSVSIGVAGYRDGDNRHKMTARADKALYSAKQGGKNRVVTDENLP